MKKTALRIGAAAAVLAAAFAAGRLTAPTQTRDRIVTSDREVSSHVAAYVGHTEIVARTKTKWKEDIKWFPDGSVQAKREQVQDTEKKASADEASTQSATAVGEKTTETERVPVVSRPRWAVEAMAGATLDERRPVGGLGAQVRLGDWWVGAWGMATTETRAAGMSLRKEF